MSVRIDIQPLFEWLLDGAPGADGSAAVVAGLAARLVGHGVRVTRIASFVRTLHPNVMGRSFIWRGGEVEVRDSPYDIIATDEFKKSPVQHVYRSGRELRRRVEGDDALEFEVLGQLRSDGLTDYCVLPLRFINGETHAIAYATDVAGGFSDEELQALRDVTRPLSRLAEVLAVRRTATALLNAYVGREAGERILRGQIQRGDTESIRCVIWFSDLRGFTSLSGERAPAEIILVLNRVFDCQVDAVERHGGEVLKFMGDGMLAIFPVGGERAAAAVCDEALAAGDDAFAALDALNGERAARGETALEFGVSLHLGDVAYGNIGSATRLDFTCIGAAVNLAARIESLTARLGKRLLVSQAFASASAAALRDLGAFELKGIAGTTRVFERAG